MSCYYYKKPYGVLYYMKAQLIYRNKVVTENTITEFVIWRLPGPSQDRPHGLKYRLYHGDVMGQCLVRYDNESGKGDHKHLGNKEAPYVFLSVEQLMQDFMTDIARLKEEV
jgi:hypothetical protein